MDPSTSILISAGGVLVSVGVAYGVLKSAVKHLAESITKLETKVTDSVKALDTKVEKVAGIATDCDKRIAMVQRELELRDRLQVVKRDG